MQHQPKERTVCSLLRIEVRLIEERAFFLTTTCAFVKLAAI